MVALAVLVSGCGQGLRLAPWWRRAPEPVVIDADVVTASHFVLRDENGQIRGSLEWRSPEGAAVLSLADANSTLRAELGVRDGEGAELWLFDEEGRRRLGVDAGDSEEPRFVIFGDAGQVRFSAGTDRSGGTGVILRSLEGTREQPEGQATSPSFGRVELRSGPDRSFVRVESGGKSVWVVAGPEGPNVSFDQPAEPDGKPAAENPRR